MKTNQAAIASGNVFAHNYMEDPHLAGPPSWWGCRPWPPIGPDVPGLAQRIPAQDRHEGVGDPPCPDEDAEATPDSGPDAASDVPGDDSEGNGSPGCGCTLAR